MNLHDLRVAVSQEEAEAALFSGDYETYDGWMRPVTLADLERLGEKVWWCGPSGLVMAGPYCDEVTRTDECGWRIFITIPDEVT